MPSRAAQSRHQHPHKLAKAGLPEGAIVQKLPHLVRTLDTQESRTNGMSLASATKQRETSGTGITAHRDVLPIAAQRDADPAANVVIAVVEVADVAVASSFSNPARLIDVRGLAGATSIHAKSLGRTAGNPDTASHALALSFSR